MKSKRYYFNISEELFYKFKTLCDIDGTSVTSAITKMIKKRIETIKARKYKVDEDVYIDVGESETL